MAAFAELYAALVRTLPRVRDALQEVVIALILCCSRRIAILAAALAACAMHACVAMALGVSCRANA